METKYYVELHPYETIENPPGVTDGRVVIEPGYQGLFATVYVTTEEHLNHDTPRPFAVSAYQLRVDWEGKLDIRVIWTN
jgi:hypothetical protein